MSEPNLHLGLVGPIPPPNGGMAMQTRQLGDLLEKEGIIVEQVATNSPYRPAFIENIKVLRAFFRLIPYLFKIWRMAGRVDVIHLMANSGWSWQLFSAPVIWIGWLRNTPVIVNYRGGKARSYLKESLIRIKPSLDKATCIAVPSRFLAEVFEEFGFSVKVIPNIVNVERFKPAPRALESGRFTLIVTRNLETIYGLDTAIKAVNMVRDSIPGVRLLIAGSGPQEQELKDLVKSMGLVDIIEFVGRLGPDEIVAFYQSADLMLNPSKVDNMPNSILEALACGVTVVSTNVGGISYFVEDGTTALLVPPERPGEMAAAIIKLYNGEQLRRRLSDAGVAEVGKYSWQNIRHCWIDLYSEVARLKLL